MVFTLLIAFNIGNAMIPIQLGNMIGRLEIAVVPESPSQTELFYIMYGTIQHWNVRHVYRVETD